VSGSTWRELMACSSFPCTWASIGGVALSLRDSFRLTGGRGGVWMAGVSSFTGGHGAGVVVVSEVE